MRTGRPKVDIQVSQEDEQLLQKSLNSSHSKTRDKARLILTAKNRTHSIIQLSKLIGRTTTTVQRWFNKWKTGGYYALMEMKKPTGCHARLSPELQEELRQMLLENKITIHQTRKWLEEKGVMFSHTGTHYWIRKLRDR